MGFYSTNKVGTLWSVLYFYCNWQISAKKTTTTREWEGMGVILPGVDGTGFSPSFLVGLGREEINFCGSGTGEVWEFTPVSPSNVQCFTDGKPDTWLIRFCLLTLKIKLIVSTNLDFFSIFDNLDSFKLIRLEDQVACQLGQAGKQSKTRNLA